jgi:hypothetical protein
MKMEKQNEKIASLINEVTAPRARFDNVDMSSAMTTITSKKVATATTTHKFSGEKVTVTRTNRSDHDPFILGILVHYPSGDLGVWRFYAEKRVKIAQREYHRLVRQTIKLHPGLDHMVGAVVEVVEVTTGIHSEERLSARKAEQKAETIEIKAEPKEEKSENNVFATRKEAREFCKAQGIAQSKAQKIDDKWIVANV